MEISVNTQLFQSLYALALGAAFGFFYDLLRAVRRRIKLGVIATVADTVFWIVVGAALFIMGMAIGHGEVRIFMVIGTVLGAVLYFVSLSKFTLSICDLILDGIIKLIGIIISPFIWLEKYIKKLIKKLKKLFKKSTNCGIIKNSQFYKVISKRRWALDNVGDDVGESKKGRKVYEDNYIGPDSVRSGNHYKSSGTNPRRQRSSGSGSRRSRKNYSGKRRHGI